MAGSSEAGLIRSSGRAWRQCSYESDGRPGGAPVDGDRVIGRVRLARRREPGAILFLAGQEKSPGLLDGGVFGGHVHAPQRVKGLASGERFAGPLAGPAPAAIRILSGLQFLDELLRQLTI